MTHSFRANYFHLIWSTKNRENTITKDIQARLYGYIGKVIKEHNAKLLEIGGTLDHVHLLVGFNLPDKFCDLIRDVKSTSSLWLNKNFLFNQVFAWQEGYGAFSVSYSALDKIKNYIINQEEHHKTYSFDEEYFMFLKKHNIPYDERFVLG